MKTLKTITLLALFMGSSARVAASSVHQQTKKDPLKQSDQTKRAPTPVNNDSLIAGNIPATTMGIISGFGASFIGMNHYLAQSTSNQQLRNIDTFITQTTPDSISQGYTYCSDALTAAKNGIITTAQWFKDNSLVIGGVVGATAALSLGYAYRKEIKAGTLAGWEKTKQAVHATYRAVNSFTNGFLPSLIVGAMTSACLAIYLPKSGQQMTTSSVMPIITAKPSVPAMPTQWPQGLPFNA